MTNVMPPYQTLHVANSVLGRAFKEGRNDITPLKLQKMVYFLNGWHLAIEDIPAIDAPFEAWQYGPAVSIIYQEFKDFGRNGINRYAKEFDLQSGEFKSYIVGIDQIKFYEILDAVWEQYVGYSPLTLSAMTHQDASPWSTAYASGGGKISSKEIKNYFVSTVISREKVKLRAFSFLPAKVVQIPRLAF